MSNLDEDWTKMQNMYPNLQTKLFYCLNINKKCQQYCKNRIPSIILCYKWLSPSCCLFKHLNVTWCDDGAGGRVRPRSVCVDTRHWAVSRVLVITWHVSWSRVTCHVAAALVSAALAYPHHKPPRAPHLTAWKWRVINKTSRVIKLKFSLSSEQSAP